MTRTNDSLIALRKILRATELHSRDLAQSAGLTAVQLRVLQVIGETGCTTAKAIAVRMGVSQATVTALIDRLVRQGMVVRDPSKRDRRQIDIRITDKGASAVNLAPDALQQMFVGRFEGLQDWEQAMIVAALERVAGLLGAKDIDAAPVLTSGDIQQPPDTNGPPIT